MDKIKKTIDEFLDELAGCGEQLRIPIIEKKQTDIEYHVRINGELLRVYNTKKGISIDKSQVKNTTEVNKILNKWTEIYKTESSNAVYTYTKIGNIEEIIENINNVIVDSDYIMSDKEIKNPLVKMLKIIYNNKTHEKLTLIYYQNQTLTVQGSQGVFWETICQIIEKAYGNIQSKEILKRIINNDTYEELINYEDSLKELLSEEIYKFLSNEDKEYLLTAHELISEERKFRIYTPILCSAALALEGYLKTLLINLKLVKVMEIAKPKFNFGSVFEKGDLITKHYNVLKSNYTNSDIIKKQLENLYCKIKSFRDPICHSGAGVSPYTLKIKSFEKCKKLYYDEYIKTIKESYNKIFLKEA